MMNKITAVRWQEIDAGHTVTNHESKCRHLHGHRYTIHFHCEADDLDEIGRVIDFSVIKERLCLKVEDMWDHRFLINKIDPRLKALQEIDPDSIVVLDFNPTAELMANYLLNVIGPEQLKDTNVTLIKVVVEETRKCSAIAEKE